MSASNRTRRILAALVALLTLSLPAFAGPPLICHPFITGGAPLLPWVESRDWRSPDPAYDTRLLTADTLELLSADAPILARMENLRRATIYAVNSPRAANELLEAILARTETPAGAATALAWFDAGYLIETYRQYALVVEHGMIAPKGFEPPLTGPSAALDGHAWALKAAALAPELTPEVEFAVSLMVRDNAVAAEHRRRAAAAADDGSLLALNLASW